MNKKIAGIGVFLITLLGGIALAQNILQNGRQNISWPDFGGPRGQAGADLVNNSIKVLSNNDDSVFRAFNTTDGNALAGSSVTTVDHNFGIVFADLTIKLYTGEHPNLVRVADPVGSGWTIAANATNPRTEIDITAPPGGPFDIALQLGIGPTSEVANIGDLSDVDVTTTPPEEGQAIVFDGSSWVPGASGDSSLKLQSVTGNNAVVKEGFLLLDDGIEIFSSADLTVDLSTITAPEAACSTPTDATNCFLYIDRTLIGPGINGDRGSIQVQADDFALFTTGPEVVDLARYIPVGYVVSADSGNTWDGTNSRFGTLAFRRHDPNTGLKKVDLNDAYTDDLRAGRKYLASITSAKTLSVEQCLFDGQEFEVAANGVDFATLKLTLNAFAGDTFRRGSVTDAVYEMNASDEEFTVFYCDVSGPSWVLKEKTTTVSVDLTDYANVNEATTWTGLQTFSGGVSVSGSAGNILSGTFTPSINAVQNGSGSSASLAHYSRAGNVVTFTIAASLTNVADNGETIVDFGGFPPQADPGDFTSSTDVIASASLYDSDATRKTVSAVVESSAATDTVRLFVKASAGNGGNFLVKISGMYEIQ